MKKKNEVNIELDQEVEEQDGSQFSWRKITFENISFSENSY